MDRQTIDRHASSTEFFSWALVVCCMLTFGVPSYNAPIGFWGAYCAHCRHSKVVSRGIFITSFSLLYDLSVLLIFMPLFPYSLPILCPVIIKPLTALVCAVMSTLQALLIYFECHLFSALGGSRSMTTDGSSGMNQSAYANLVASTASMGASSTGGTGYYPPDDLSHSLVMEGGNQKAIV